MYKKKQWPYMLVALFLVMGSLEIIAQNSPKPPPPPPPAPNLIRGNWNHVMDPTGCVILDANDHLSILVRISVGTPDVTPFEGLFYKTQFQGGIINMEGPITNAMLVPETLANGCHVYTFEKEVYNESFFENCMQDPESPISFDYHISLVDTNGNPYPLETNIGIIKTCQMAQNTDSPGSSILPTMVYEGNHDLCCSESQAGGEMFFVDQNDEHQFENDRTDQTDDSELLNNQEIQLNQPINEISRINEIQEIAVFPNPFQETLNLQFVTTTAAKTTIQLWNTSGQLINQMEIENVGKGIQDISMPTDHLASDIYFCKIKSDSWSKTFKVIKI